MNAHDADTKYVVPALMQGLQLLALFSQDESRLGAPEIGRRLKLSRTKVFRLLHTLQLMGYVQRDQSDRYFKLGPALLSRGFEYLASLDIVEVAQPVLERLRDETGLSAHMAILDGQEVVYVIRHAARTTIASSVNIGTRFPVHATVMGRMIICEYSDAELKALFGSETLKRFSPQTPTSMTALKQLLVEDVKRGYAVSQSFFENGVSSIAAPVRDGNGRIVAAINITAVDNHIDLKAMNGPLKDAVLRASAEITKWLRRSASPLNGPAPATRATPRKKEQAHV